MACYFYTGSWTIIEIVSHFVDPFAEWSRGNSLSVLWTLHSRFTHRWDTIYTKM